MVEENLIEKLKKIKLVVLDVDGVLTDGYISINSDGKEFKRFSVYDGLAIRICHEFGIQFAIISGRVSKITHQRAMELGIDLIRQGIKDKGEELKKVVALLGVNFEEVLYVGDDLYDIIPMKIAGVSATVQNGVKEVKEIANIISGRKGGEGAIREILEMVLKAKGVWRDVIKKFSSEKNVE